MPWSHKCAMAKALVRQTHKGCPWTIVAYLADAVTRQPQDGLSPNQIYVSHDIPSIPLLKQSSCKLCSGPGYCSIQFFVHFVRRTGNLISSRDLLVVVLIISAWSLHYTTECRYDKVAFLHNTLKRRQSHSSVVSCGFNISSLIYLCHWCGVISLYIYRVIMRIRWVCSEEAQPIDLV